MKTRTYFLVAFSGLLIFLLTNCGGGGMKTSKNEFLGEIPSIQKYYHDKIGEIEKEIKTCTDINKAFKLDKEQQQLKEEWEAKIKESMNANPLAAALPSEPINDPSLSVTKISVTNVNTMGFGIKFAIKINKDIKFDDKDLFIYYQAIDKDGKEIEGTKTKSLIRRDYGQELKAGTDVEATGAWSTKAICAMEDFAKIKFISQTEFEKK